MPAQFLVISGEWLDIKGVTRASMAQVKALFELEIRKAQQKLVETRGRSIGLRWAPLKPATIRWKDRHGIPPFLLHGRTGRLLELVRRPTLVSFVEQNRVSIDVLIADEAKSDRGFRYAYAVHHGWRQRVQATPRSGSGWSQLDWMREYLWGGYQAGQEFRATPRKLVGFGEEQAKRWAEEAYHRVLGTAISRRKW